jgi:hypothetical protein
VFHAINGLPGWLYRPMLLAQYLEVLAMPLVVAAAPPAPSRLPSMHSFMTCQRSTFARGAQWRPPDSSSDAARALTSQWASTVNVAVNENPAERRPSLLCCMPIELRNHRVSASLHPGPTTENRKVGGPIPSLPTTNAQVRPHLMA